MIDKKAIRNAYKLTPPKPGIYCITNESNQKRFIGSARNVLSKINAHKFSLLAGGHILSALQADYNLAGESQFTFEVLEFLKQHEDVHHDYSEELAEREKYWLEKYLPYDDAGYNKRKIDFVSRKIGN